MSDIVYRDATAEDAETLAAFSADTFVDTFGHLYPPDDLAAYLAASYGAPIQAREIADADTLYRLALRDGAIVGYCKMGALNMEVADANALELQRLYVASDVKGAGVARALMQDTLDWARNAGAAALYLSVWENNTRAQAFYRRYGFEHMGEHAFMVGSVADRDFIWRLTL